MVFNRLTTIKIIEENKTKSNLWLCRCSCGNFKEIRASSISRGQTKSCGCLGLGIGKSKINIGDKFGLLVALEEIPKEKGKPRFWRCKCDCGKETTKTEISMFHGRTRSCGCLCKVKPKYGELPARFIPEYKIWKDMKRRCSGKSKKHVSYKERGTSVCDRWKNSFENFYADMGPRPNESYSIDRINNNGNYEPANCRWATIYEQANNTRSNVFLDFEGKRQTVAQWAKEKKIPETTLKSRLRRNWSANDALSTPLLRKKEDLNDKVSPLHTLQDYVRSSCQEHPLKDED